ncbi:MAG: hypothetical protein ACLUV8_14770 [Clostridium sp.]
MWTDTGDILETKVIPLDPKETSGSLFEIKRRGVHDPVNFAGKGTITRTPQGKKAPVMQRCSLDIRGDQLDDVSGGDRTSDPRFKPWPSAYTFIMERLKALEADGLEEAVPAGAVPGQVLQADKHGLTVATGEGILKINELQLEGKKRMPADALLRGFTITPGEILGERE